MKLVYDINQKPPLKKNLVYAFQQLLAIMAATLLVPVLADSTGLYLNQPAALFGAGMTAGGGLIVSYYRSLKGVQDSERRIAARNMDAARRYNEAMRLELDNKTDCLNRLELKRQLEASWCDGYEAGMREGMRGVTVGDVVTFTRLRRARDNRAAND